MQNARMMREMLRWVQGNEIMRIDSLQALGCMRCLKSIWKQGRYGETAERF